MDQLRLGDDLRKSTGINNRTAFLNPREGERALASVSAERCPMHGIGQSVRSCPIRKPIRRKTSAKRPAAIQSKHLRFYRIGSTPRRGNDNDKVMYLAGDAADGILEPRDAARLLGLPSLLPCHCSTSRLGFLEQGQLDSASNYGFAMDFLWPRGHRLV